MKKIKYKIAAYTILLVCFSMVFSLQSCSQSLDINSDPNNPTVVPLRTLLTSSEVSLGYYIGGSATRMPASIVQHYGGHRGQPLSYSQYAIASSDTDGFWSYMYSGTLIDLKRIQQEGEKSNDLIYVGIAQILQAYSYSILTDLFGDIPFTESLKLELNITPKYDKQESIYPALIAMIDKGIANVSSNSGSKPSTDDLIYAGDPNKWVRFANSLKLRLYNHMSKRSPSLVTDFLATNPLLIDAVSFNAKVPFGTANTNANPIYQFDILSGRADQAVASTIVDKLKSLSDPRIDVYFKKVLNNGSGFQGQYRGNLPGNDVDDSGQNLYSRVGSAYASIASPVILMSAAEVSFIKAEVYNKAGSTSLAKTAYENAITFDFSALNVSGIAAYLANANVAYDGTLSRVMEQKWITMYQASYESWVDWRRTGYPVLALPKNNRITETPRKLPYPQVEINVNGANLAAGPGIPVEYENMKKRVWWDAATSN